MTDKFISFEAVKRAYPSAEGRTTIVFDNLWFSMGTRRIRLRHRSFRLRQNHVLNILAGLDRRTAALSQSTAWKSAGPSLDRAVIFQSHALLPWRSVLGNVAYAVASRWPRWMRTQVREHAERFIALVGLKGSEGKKPAALSGGNEAACRHCPRAGDRAQDLADGRTLFVLGRFDPRHIAGRSASHLS